jgi:hypothetical protein
MGSEARNVSARMVGTESKHHLLEEKNKGGLQWDPLLRRELACICGDFSQKSV